MNHLVENPDERLQGDDLNDVLMQAKRRFAFPWQEQSCVEMREIIRWSKSILIFRNHVKPRNQKYSASRLTQLTRKTPAIPSRGEGRWPSSLTLGRVAVDAAASGACTCSQGGLP
jgi:hypothetical protein